MYQRIMEILVILMDEFSDKSWKTEQMDQFGEDLLQRGYTEQEINTAFYWLYHRLNRDKNVPPQTLEVTEPSQTSHRVLHVLESRLLTPQAFGYLLQLRHLRLVSSKEMEEIIERLLLLDIRPASVEDVKIVTQSVMFDENGLWVENPRSAGSNHRGETYH